MKKIIFAGKRLFLKYPDMTYFQERAEGAGFEVELTQVENDEEFAHKVRDASAVAVLGRRITSELINSMDRCRIIQNFSVGYDCVDLAAATVKGIIVSNVPAYCTDEVANHAITLLFSAARKIVLSASRTAKGLWDCKFARPIHNFRNRNLGIIGLGKIGRNIVSKAKGFGMNVLAFDPYVADDIFSLLGVERKYELDGLLAAADYVSIHAPLTQETSHLIDERAFGLMKEGAILINTARGEIVDEKALYEAAAEGIIGGAGLDVLEDEPPSEDNPLFALDNITVTPHIAWYSEESFSKCMVQGMDEVISVLDGMRPKFIVNPGIFNSRKPK